MTDTMPLEARAFLLGLLLDAGPTLRLFSRGPAGGGEVMLRDFQELPDDGAYTPTLLRRKDWTMKGAKATCTASVPFGRRVWPKGWFLTVGRGLELTRLVAWGVAPPPPENLGTLALSVPLTLQLD